MHLRMLNPTMLDFIKPEFIGKEFYIEWAGCWTPITIDRIDINLDIITIKFHENGQILDLSIDVHNHRQMILK